MANTLTQLREQLANAVRLQSEAAWHVDRQHWEEAAERFRDLIFWLERQ